MCRSSLTFQVGVVLIAICLLDVVVSEDRRINRQKRGFRMNSASRVAHGYGKRGYQLPSSSSSGESQDQLESYTGLLEELSDGPLMTVNEFTQLMTGHPNLARALVKKFVDINGDDVISTEELFRPVMTK
ncbi:allatotropins-like [Biomphalaria glabrata]|uniref:Allatotropins-like n=3 Tax=Biomphalaria TaxID=6525 RepID=A0A9W2Z4D4_BIOGL|nr:allatotropins-like [Biomphalaria glabrata]XP_055869856.1 allatotropins-like [Biomphalaria glabrata]ATN96645.1 allatotropin-like peptide precursor [Biomphalaria alexandrina]KAI8744997.1 allatotropin-like peptide precursor [Biomphalaria glabrata]